MGLINSKAEADRLVLQAIQQYESNEFEASIESWQQARNLYRIFSDRIFFTRLHKIALLPRTVFPNWHDDPNNLSKIQVEDIRRLN